MGCFLACFGSSKDRKRRKQRQRHHHNLKVVQCRDQKNEGINRGESTVSRVRDYTEKPSSPVSDKQQVIEKDNIDEQLSLSARKRVTFDSNIKTYEHVSEDEVPKVSLENMDGGKMEDKEENVVKARQVESPCDESSVTTSSGSNHPNHRYQNCRDSDDELEYEESDVDVDEDEDEDEDYGEIDYEDMCLEGEKVDSRFRKAVGDLVIEEIDNYLATSSLPERELKMNRNARDRSTYVHPVLNPVENLTQWKAVKAKGTESLRRQKENLKLDDELRVSISSDHSFKESSFSFKSSSNRPTRSNQEFAVDASLSNWLGSSENTPRINKPTDNDSDTVPPTEKSMPMGSHSPSNYENRPIPGIQGSHSPRSYEDSPKSTAVQGSHSPSSYQDRPTIGALGSHSPSSYEDRPILGALTMKEIRQFSNSCSPKRSPCRSPSPDDMPIIGSVGTYWNDNVSKNDSHRDASSYKGIPNTTSKYREDKKVNWHTTPFETRLERALNSGVA